MEKIFVKETDIPKTSTRQDFIRQFLKIKPSSYNDENYTNLQCESGRFRSITELHEVVKSRFPVTSFEAILRIVKTLIDEEGAGVSMVYCTQVNKVVLRYFNKSTKKYITSFSRDNYYKTKGVDGYSLEDYEKMIEKLNKIK